MLGHETEPDGRSMTVVSVACIKTRGVTKGAHNALGNEKSQKCRKCFLQYSVFASERSQFRTWGRQTCFLPRAPSNLGTPQSKLQNFLLFVSNIKMIVFITSLCACVLSDGTFKHNSKSDTCFSTTISVRWLCVRVVLEIRRFFGITLITINKSVKTNYWNEVNSWNSIGCLTFRKLNVFRETVVSS